MTETNIYMPPWLMKAWDEIDVAEVPGKQSNPRILEYHRATSLKASLDEIPWCSSFVNWCMKECGIPGTNNAAAKSWLYWGKSITIPAYGAITVLHRGDNNALGHVGFLVDVTDSEIKLLGGNQGDKVSFQKFDRSKVVSYRWF